MSATRWLGIGVAVVLGAGAVVGFQRFMRAATTPTLRDPITLARYDAWDEVNGDAEVIDALPLLSRDFQETDTTLRSYGYELISSSPNADRFAPAGSEEGRVFYSIKWDTDRNYGCTDQTTVAILLNSYAEVISASAYQDAEFTICH